MSKWEIVEEKGKGTLIAKARHRNQTAEAKNEQLKL